MDEEQMRAYWRSAPAGRLCPWEQAKALALREVGKKLNEGEPPKRRGCGQRGGLGNDGQGRNSSRRTTPAGRGGWGCTGSATRKQQEKLGRGTGEEGDGGAQGPHGRGVL